MQTHFSNRTDSAPTADKFNLSPVTENEGLPGQWYTEYKSDEEYKYRDAYKWSSWENRRSFWIQREYLLQAIHEVGFDLVMEQFDSLEPGIAEGLLRGYYKTDLRGTFIGIKTSHEAKLLGAQVVPATQPAVAKRSNKPKLRKS